MKKLIAILLSLVCVLSVSAPAYASNDDVLDNIIGDIVGIEPEEDVDDKLSYGIHYESATISTESIMYMPSPNITFEVPTEVTVTNDTPIAVDHNWVAWKDAETGQLYYPGDTIYVTGKVTLIAVWEEKDDNLPSFFRAIVAGLQTLVRLIDKFLGAFDAINSTKPMEPTTEAVTE
ncbi:MAG: hypothetical protein ACI4GC_00420 [Acutalibacteraceae bacterium]